MSADESACTLAIEIEVTDMKLASCPCKFFFVSTVNSSGQTELRVVRNPQRIVVVVCFDHCQYRSENLFLFNRRAGFYVGNDGRLDKEPLLAVRPAAGQNPATFSFT